MNNKQLKNLVISYQESSCEVKFSEIFEKVSEVWKRNKVLYSLARKYGLDFSEVESLANWILYETVNKYESTGNFYNFLSVALSRKCINLRRDSAKYIDNEISLNTTTNSDEDDSDNPLLDYLVCANAEDEAIENLQKKSDQSQLVAQLIDKAPEKCSQALKAYVESDFSYPEAAKLLNTSYPAVKRRVEKIATYFDANQNGSVYDYFTVATSA